MAIWVSMRGNSPLRVRTLSTNEEFVDLDGLLD
jgi:hypothetical protein